MRYQIQGDTLPVVICQLEGGERMITQGGGMAWMSPNMLMETTTNGGLGKAFGRMFSGEHIFQNIYTSQRGTGMIAFASSFPGSIKAFQIAPGQEMIFQKSAFLASEAGVELSVFFNKKFSSGLFGGEGFIMQKVSGHGIPDKHRIIREGDIVSLDAGVIYKGYHSDAARTHGIGTISKEAEDLIRITRECFFEGIKYAKEGNYLFDISAAIGNYAQERGYGVVRDLCGHGIGTALHEAPEIPNYKMNRKGVKLKAGMTLAIEPMINIGTWEVDWLDDDWTVVSRDRSLSAHYENTVLITKDEPILLTLTQDS